jgi:uncharacterized protein (TIGR03437 family)
MCSRFSRRLLTLVAFGGAGGLSAASGPGIIAVGSAITWGGTNAPDTFSQSTTFSSTPVQVDNGSLTIWQQQVPTGSNGEWDIFYMKTTNGGPLAGNLGGYWEILIDFTLTAAAYFDHVFMQWQVNGSPVSPLSNGVGTICCAVTSTPLSNILPGPAYYNSGFSVGYPAGQFSKTYGSKWQQVYATPYTIVGNGGINPSSANGFVFALHWTLQAPPNITSVISAGQFGAFQNFGPGSWIEIYGTNLGEISQQWANSDFNGLAAPTKVGGTSVTIGGQAAYVGYVSPDQINAQVPGGLSPGSQSLVVTTEAGSSMPFPGTVVASQPGLLAPPAFTIGATPYVAALFADGAFVLAPGAISGITSRRAKPGDTIMLYGVDFGQVNQGIPPGQIAQGQTSLAAPLSMSISGSPATLRYQGLAPGFVGLYQFNVVVPSIAASDAAPLTFTLGGVAGTQKLFLAIGN